MADGPFRGEKSLRDTQRERGVREEIADVRMRRREATIDAVVGFVGCPAALFHAFAPWAELFDMLGVRWLPYVAAAIMFLWGAYNAVDAVRLRRAERLLT